MAQAKRSKSTTSSGSSSAGSKAAKPRVTHDPQGLPKLIYAQASPRSVGGRSMFEMGSVSADSVQAVMSEPEIVLAAGAQLQEAGFSVLQVSSTTINIAGPASLYRSAFNIDLITEDRPVIKEGSTADIAQFVECPNTDLPGLISTSGTPFANLIEGLAIEEPRYYMAANAFPPPVGYWHLSVPAGVSLAARADKAHRGGTTGSGMKVVMCDSGHFAHPFFAERGYRVGPVVLGPGASAPAADESGHGTAESANVFAVAPDVDFTMVKMSFVNSIGAFNAAVGLAPHVLSCSWGSDKQNPPLSAADNALAAAIATAVANGIIVIFSAGNGHFGFPGQHPDVISAGGVFLAADGSMRASDYASGFASAIYSGRNVPDLSGLVGMRPRASYIMLPVEPNDEIDQSLGNGAAHPDGDETPSNDGWAAISGTSAAAPQLAGAAALVKQACPRLTPAEVRDVLRTTARDVTAGRNFNRTGMNHLAVTGPDLATGHGLVDVNRAVVVAKLRCLRSIAPIAPIQPITPIAPIQPITPIVPVTPVAPIAPIRPVGPPISPSAAQAASGQPAADQQVGLPLSAQDVSTLEEIISAMGDDLGL